MVYVTSAHIPLERILSHGHTYFQGSLENTEGQMDFVRWLAAEVTIALSHHTENFKCSL